MQNISKIYNMSNMQNMYNMSITEICKICRICKIICRICKICVPSSPYEYPPFRMNIPFIVCTIWQNMAKNMQNLNIPPKNMQKIKNFKNFKNMSSQKGPYRSGKTRFEIFIFVIYMHNM